MFTILLGHVLHGGQSSVGGGWLVGVAALLALATVVSASTVFVRRRAAPERRTGEVV